MTRTAIETYTGTFFDFAEPTAEMIHVHDIARALSYTARFGGHTSRFYSVAEHALLVARLVRDAGGSRELEFAALHHDSHEAYVGDLPTPLKDWIKAHAPGVYEELTHSIDEAISEKFGIWDSFHDSYVKNADARALEIEASALKRSRSVGAEWGRPDAEPADWRGYVGLYAPAFIESEFLRAHNRLAGGAA